MTNLPGRSISIVIALAIAGCATAAAGSPDAGRRHHSPVAVALAARRPLPATTLRRLPPGEFYLMSGDPSGLSYAVWKVSASGGQHLIQPSGPGRDNGVRAFSAARADIVASVARTGIDDLTRLTSHGPYWLPHGKPAVHGFDPQVTGSGQLFCYTPPARHGDWVIWASRSFSALPRKLYQQRGPIGSITVGPCRHVATWREPFSEAPKHPPRVVIISPAGRVRRLATGYPNIGNLVWGPRAPAIAVQGTNLGVELLFLSGRRLSLPKGWYPYTWSPSGRTLLLVGASSTLGTWSLRAPGRIHVIGKITPHVGIGQVSWLAKPAKL
jgi:hypothetical protein